MKGSQKNKKGKLLAQFSSGSHKAALGDYCEFNKKNYRIDVLLDKAKRIALLEEELHYSKGKLYSSYWILRHI